MRGKLAAVVFLLAVSFQAWPAQSKKPTAKPFKAEFVTVHQEADKLDYDDKAKIMHLEGHVKLWQPDSTLFADKATYYLNTEEAEADGNIKMTNPDGTITGDHLHMYYREKRVVVEKNVSLLITKQFSVEEKNSEFVDKSPVTVTADSVEYKWGDKIANADGHVTVTQKGRKAWGDHGVYDEKADQLTMDGNVKLFRPPKDTLYSDHLVFLMKTNKATAEGHVHGTFLVKKESDKSVPPSKKQTTSGSMSTPAPEPSPTPTPSPSPSASPAPSPSAPSSVKP